MKRLISIILSLTLCSTMSIPISAKEVNPKQDSEKVQNIQKLNKLSNGNLKLSEKDGQVFLTGKLADKQVPGEKSATKFLEENKPIFGIDNTTR